MKKYKTFSAYLAAQGARNRTIIRALRALVKRTAPELEEAVKWGNGCWVGGNGVVAYVYSAKEYVQFGFFRGVRLKDPKGLLEGEGKYLRHIKVRKASEIDTRAFTALIKQAVRIR